MKQFVGNSPNTTNWRELDMSEITAGREIWIRPAICQKMRFGHTPLYALGFDGKVLRVNERSQTATVDILDGGKPIYIDLADIGEAYPVEEMLNGLKREYENCLDNDRLKDMLMRNIQYVESNAGA